MLRLILSAAMIAALSTAGQATAQSNNGFANSGFPFGFGFYQPYGIQYSTTVRTPPYFAVNPPVYYGERHYRPYGASPFASLPLVQAGRGYTTRAAGEFQQQTLSVPHPSAAMVNPFCATDAPTTEAPKIVEVVDSNDVASVIQNNPYVGSQIARSNEVYSGNEFVKK